METTLLTLWSIAHFLTGVAFGFVFNLRYKSSWVWIIPISIIAMLVAGNVSALFIGITAIGMVLGGMTLNHLAKKGIKFNTIATLTLVFLILIAWEFFERYVLVKIPLLQSFAQESVANSIADVVIGFGAFLVTYFILKRKR